jgi:undecaprenol kinase/diacylglycerol kinase (ATP)
VAVLLHKQMSPIDWAVIVLVIGIVIGMEILNTAIENIVDVVSFKYNYNAKKIKDVSAAATLVLTITSIAVGLIIFIPKIIAVFS